MRFGDGARRSLKQMNGVVSRAKLKRESRTLSSKRGKRLCWKNSSKRLTIPKLIWCKWDTRLVRISSLLNSFDDSSHYQHRFANKGTTHFSLESDRAILCGVVKHGYGAWEKIREDMSPLAVLARSPRRRDPPATVVRLLRRKTSSQ